MRGARGMAYIQEIAQPTILTAYRAFSSPQPRVR